jgi:hypothetical protein
MTRQHAAERSDAALTCLIRIMINQSSGVQAGQALRGVGGSRLFLFISFFWFFDIGILHFATFLNNSKRPIFQTPSRSRNEYVYICMKRCLKLSLYLSVLRSFMKLVRKNILFKITGIAGGFCFCLDYNLH